MANSINFSEYGFLDEILALTEDNWRKYFKPVMYDSVQNGLQVTAGSGMTFNISSGECRCGAVMGILNGTASLSIDAGSSNARIDSIVAQYEYGDTSILSLTVVKGTPSSSPVAPTLTKTFNTLWQMELAQIAVPANATSASQCTITDKRVIYTSIDSVINPILEDIDTINDEIVSITTNIDTINDEIISITANIDAINNEIVSITTNIDTINDEIVSITTNVDAINDEITIINDKINTVITGEFSTSTTYNIGDYVIYNNTLYRFTYTHPAGAWNNNHVVAVTIGSELKNINSEISHLTYQQISEIVKSGFADQYFNIGEQITVKWDNGSTNYDLPFDIVAIRDVVDADGNTVPGMILQAHWVLPGVQFDASEAAYVASAIIPAGTYYIEIGQNWGNNCKANYKYEFTTTKDVPVNGQIVMTRSGNNQYTWGAPDQNPSTWVVYTFASNTSTTPIEGPLSLTEYTNEQTPSSTSLGTLLQSTKYSSNGINNLQRAAYGYNRWSQSAMRQWLNSSAVAGSWWTPKNPFDRQPQQLASMRGFMAGLDSDFLSIIKPVTITTALNTISDSEIGESETTTDKFFCASLEEEYCVPQLAGVEGAYWPYWKERLELNSPQASGADNANVNHIRYLISNHSSAQYVRLRSAGRGSASTTWIVYTTGYVSTSYATTSLGSCPACVIC